MFSKKGTIHIFFSSSVSTQGGSYCLVQSWQAG